MRRLVLGMVGTLAMAGLIAAGCGDDGDDDDDGSGATTTVPTGGGNVGGGNVGGGNTGGGSTGTCTEVTFPFDYLGTGMMGLPFYYGGLTSPTLGGADEDWLFLEHYDPELTGEVDLAAGEQASYATCTACFTAYEDLPEEGEPARIFFQRSGTVDFGTTTPYYIAGSVTDLTLVEVTINQETYEATPVEGGACLHIASVTFDIQPPAEGWTCDPLYYEGGAGDGCDCACGVVDPDCSLEPAEEVYGCYEGQTCNATAECEGVPTDWTCEDANWDSGDGCHCGCGLPDPDCEAAPTPVTGCEAEQICSEGYCIPEAWTCDPSYYGGGAGDGCDCECGVLDPDCTLEPAEEVYGCEDGEICLPDGHCGTA